MEVNNKGLWAKESQQDKGAAKESTKPSEIVGCKVASLLHKDDGEGKDGGNENVVDAHGDVLAFFEAGDDLAGGKGKVAGVQNEDRVEGSKGSNHSPLEGTARRNAFVVDSCGGFDWDRSK